MIKKDNKMYKRRVDGQCEARVLGVIGDRALIEARWPKDNRNILFVPLQYFQENYK